ncbi:11343_t:CDS:2 [Entrophospora sp. SA101]|nr:11343_t:CDS:2 [Entrophospora sp. SA101]
MHYLTCSIFQTWIKQVNEQMRRQQRNILLLVDNVSSHQLGLILGMFLSDLLYQYIDYGIPDRKMCCDCSSYLSRILRYFAVYPFGKQLHLFLNEFLDHRDSGHNNNRDVLDVFG